MVLDIGSYESRAGFASQVQLDDETQALDPLLEFKSVVAKPKTMIDKEIDSIHIVGSETAYFESSKLQRKPLFDRDVVTHQANLEHLLDYTFTQLGFTE